MRRKGSPEDGLCTINAETIVGFLRDRDCPQMAGLVQQLEASPQHLRDENVMLRAEVKRLQERLRKHEPDERSSAPTYASQWD